MHPRATNTEESKEGEEHSVASIDLFSEPFISIAQYVCVMSLVHHPDTSTSVYFVDQCPYFYVEMAARLIRLRGTQEIELSAFRLCHGSLSLHIEGLT